MPTSRVGSTTASPDIHDKPLRVHRGYEERPYEEAAACQLLGASAGRKRRRWQRAGTAPGARR
ncbi:MAG: hypothetical protein QW598_06160 [Pyrobaculum sp.]